MQRNFRCGRGVQWPPFSGEKVREFEEDLWRQKNNLRVMD
jgi:hypothetical protein